MANLSRITSRTNQIIVDTAKLKDKKYRDESGCFVFEGIKLFREALTSSIPIGRVFVCEDNKEACDLVSDAGLDHYVVTESVYDKLSQDRSPDGILCTCRYLTDLHRQSPVLSGSAMILCDIQDPGNLGTCIRSARAFGIDELILAGDCADIYNRRSVRAAMGALFRQRTASIPDPLEALKICRDNGKQVFATALRPDALELDQTEITDDTVFAIGNEGHGLSDDFIAAADGCVIIPMRGDTESLNASIASSIVMWEQARRRV